MPGIVEHSKADSLLSGSMENNSCRIQFDPDFGINKRIFNVPAVINQYFAEKKSLGRQIADIVKIYSL
jgi:hypothetical protein